MFTPRSFSIDNLKTIQAFIKQYSFATIFSQSNNKPGATHLPFMIDCSKGKYGTLVSHMARANPLWKSWEPDSVALIVFTGPHAYISPAWYKDQITVPTWNYSAVHAYGRPRVFHDPQLLRPMLDDLVNLYESKEESTWDKSLMESIIENELKAIVGFEIQIESFEAKFKFNQNRSEEDQASVQKMLAENSCPFKREVASFMKGLSKV